MRESNVPLIRPAHDYRRGMTDEQRLRCVIRWGADRCKALRHRTGRLGQSSRGTIGSRRFHPLRKAAYRSDGSMLPTMRAHSACPSPIPKCRSALVTTLPAAPSALPLVYSDISNCQPMAVTTVVGNLDAGSLAAAVSARERNDERAISRNRTPDTICNVCTHLHPNAPPDEPRAGRSARFRASDTGSCSFCGGAAGARRPWNVLTGFPALVDGARQGFRHLS